MKKYISPRIEEIKIMSNVIATSGGLTDGSSVGDRTVEGGSANEFAPSRYGRYREDYELF